MNYMIGEMQGKIDRLTTSLQWLLSARAIESQQNPQASAITSEQYMALSTQLDEGKGKDCGPKK